MMISGGQKKNQSILIKLNLSLFEHVLIGSRCIPLTIGYLSMYISIKEKKSFKKRMSSVRG